MSYDIDPIAKKQRSITRDQRTLYARIVKAGNRGIVLYEFIDQANAHKLWLAGMVEYRRPQRTKKWFKKGLA